MKTVLIVNGGELNKEFLKETWETERPEAVIAVDGALEKTEQANITVTHMVGDFDTVSLTVLRRYEERKIQMERHVPEKDETDSELAMELAISMRPSKIVVLGATGYRIDHELANIGQLFRPLEESIFCEIINKYNRIFLVKEHMVLYPEDGWKYISFLPFTQSVTGITLRGFKYSLTSHTMKIGVMSGRGVSNEIIGDKAEVWLDEGILLCVRSRDREKREE